MLYSNKTKKIIVGDTYVAVLQQSAEQLYIKKWLINRLVDRTETSVTQIIVLVQLFLAYAFAQTCTPQRFLFALA